MVIHSNLSIGLAFPEAQPGRPFALLFFFYAVVALPEVDRCTHTRFFASCIVLHLHVARTSTAVKEMKGQFVHLHSQAGGHRILEEHVCEQLTLNRNNCFYY